MAGRNFFIDLELRARDAMGPTLAKVAAEVKALEAAIDDGRGKIRDLDADSSKLANSIRQKLQPAVESAEKSFAEFDRRNESLSTRYQRLNDEMEKNRAITAGVAHNADDLGVAIARQTEKVEKLRGAQRDLQKTQSDLQKTTAGDADVQQTLTEEIGKNTRARAENNRKLEEAKAKLNVLNREVEQYQRSSAKATEANREFTKTEAQHQRDLDQSARSYRRATEDAAKLRKEFDEVNKTDLTSPDQKLALATLEARMKATHREAERLGRQFLILRKEAQIHGNVDVDTAAAEAHLAGMRILTADLDGKTININVNADVGAAAIKLAAVNAEAKHVDNSSQGLLSTLSQLSSHFSDSGASIARFDNTLRGLGVFLVIGLFQQLLTGVVALGGELVALASSATMAAGALGGAMAAGIAQAIPAVGLLIAVFQRLGTVMQAVQQTSLLRQQQSTQQQKGDSTAANAADSLASANDGLVNAMQGVTQANQRLQEAQIGLTKARFDARRELQDLILAEKQAALAAKAAVLDQEEAQRSLTQAIAGGDVAGVSRARLDVAGAAVDRQRADIEARRASQDLSLQRAGSPLAPDTGVHDAQLALDQARQGVEDAHRAVLQAQRGVESAKRAADDAAAGFLSSAGKLNYMLAQLDKTERGLYRALLQLRSTARQVIRPITDIMIAGFTDAINKINRVMKDPKLIGAFTDLAKSMRTEFTRVVDAFTSPKWLSFFEAMTRHAASNLKPLTTTFLAFANTFRHIAEAASPVLRDILQWISQGARQFQRWVGHGKSLRDFFQEGERHLKAWIGLVGAILHLFVALVGGPASESGLRGVKALTETIQGAAEWLEHHAKKVKEFFKGVEDVMADLGDILIALGAAILDLFDAKSFDALTKVIIHTVIPALKDTFELFGHLITAIEKFTSDPIGNKLAKFALVFAGMKLVLSPISGLIRGIAGSVVVMGERLAILAGGIKGVKAASTAAKAEEAGADIAGATTSKKKGFTEGAEDISKILKEKGPVAAMTAAFAGLELSMLAIPLAVIAVVAGFVFLAHKFGVLDDIIDAFKEAGKTILGYVKPALDDLGHTVKDLLNSIGFEGGLGDIFKKIFVDFVLHGVVPAIKVLGHVIGIALMIYIKMITIQIKIWAFVIGIAVDAVKLLINIVKGAIGVISDIIGFFSKLGHSPVIRLLGRLLTQPFKMMMTIIKSVIGYIRDQFHNIVEFFDDLFHGRFKEAFGDLVKIISQPFRSAWNLVKDIWGNVKGFFSGVAGDIGDSLGGIGGVFADAFNAAGAVVEQIVNSIIDVINFFITKIGLDKIGPVNFVGSDAPSKAQHGLRDSGGRGPSTGGGRFRGGRIGPTAPGFAQGGRVRQGRQGFFLGGVGDTLGDIGEGLIEASPIGLALKAAHFIVDSKRAIETVKRLADLPDQYVDQIRESGVWMDGIVGAVGGRALDFVVDHAKGIPGALLGAAKSVLPGWVEGGHVQGPPGLDVIPAWLTRQEFVVTPHGESVLEQVTGIPGILSWLAGVQRPATGYAEGGRVGFAEGGAAQQSQARAPAQSSTKPGFGQAQAKDALAALSGAINRFGGQVSKRWDAMWDEVQKRTKQATGVVANLTDKMNKSFAKDLKDMAQNTKSQTGKITNYIQNAMKEGDQAVFKGLGYIVKATRTGLEAFDAKDKLNIKVPAPPGIGGGGKAEGGWVGSRGERGPDKEVTFLGRGEAVLNYAHQRLVDPAMKAIYGFGLDELFKNTRAQHGKPRKLGMAGGGYTGPGHSGAGFTPVWNLAQKEFGMTYYTGFDGHSQYSSSGLVSDHFVHRALDMGNGILTRGEDALNAFFKTKVPEIVKQLIWRSVDQFNGYNIGDHTDHVHLAMDDAYAFDEERTAKILAAAQKGLDFSDLLAGGSGQAAFWKTIKDLDVKGTIGPVRDTVQGSLDMLVDAANAFGEKWADKLGGDLMGGTHSFRAMPGGWHRVGATWEGLAGATGWAGVPVGGMGFAELLVAGANAGVHPNLSDILSIPQGSQGMKAFTKIQIKKPNTLEAFSIEKNDIGSGQPDHYYVIDIQNEIADRLAGRITQDVDVKKMAAGGVVGDWHPEGHPVPIVAHSGEWVLNKMQQMKAAMASGLSVPQLKNLLGFAGGPSHFQYGGEVTAGKGESGGEVRTSLRTLFFLIQNWLSDLGRTGKHFTFLPKSDRKAASLDSIEVAERQFDAVIRFMKFGAKEIEAKNKKLDETVRTFFEGLTGDGGILDQMAASFEDLTAHAEQYLAVAQIKFENGKIVGRARQAGFILVKELESLRYQLDYLLGERGVIVKALREAHRALRVARRANDKEAEQLAQAAISNLNIRLRDLDGQIAQQQLAILEKMEEKLAARAQRVSDVADRLLTGYKPAEPLHTVIETTKHQDRLLERLRERYEEAEENENERREKHLEKRIEAILDAARKVVHSRPARLGIEIQRRIAEAMGNVDQIPGLIQDQIGVMNQEIVDLQKVLKRALKRGDKELAHQIEQQIADLMAGVVEATASLLSIAQEAIDRTFAHRQTIIDIRNRAADVRERFGDVIGATQARRSALVAQRTNTEDQIEAERELLRKAIEGGFGPGVTDPIREKLADLIEQLDENNASLYENTIAMRQVHIDNIQGRQGFLGGVTDSLGGIVTTLGAITGQINLPGLVSLAQSAIDTLKDTGGQLRDQLTAFVGQNPLLVSQLPKETSDLLSNLQGLHGQDFVDAIQGLPFEDIIAGLGGQSSPMAQQFEALIQAIIDNEAALQTNTDQLNQLNSQNQIQQFTSSAWQLFRRAIFSGMGGLLPQYAAGEPFSGAAEGAIVTKTGLVNVHAGEIIGSSSPDFGKWLRRMGGIHNIANGAQDGSMPGYGIFPGEEVPSNRYGIFPGEGVPSTWGPGWNIPGERHATDLAEIRRLVELAGDANVYIQKGEDQDPGYIAKRIAFERKIPSS